LINGYPVALDLIDRELASGDIQELVVLKAYIEMTHRGFASSEIVSRFATGSYLGFASPELAALEYMIGVQKIEQEPTSAFELLSDAMRRVGGFPAAYVGLARWKEEQAENDRVARMYQKACESVRRIIKKEEQYDFGVRRFLDEYVFRFSVTEEFYDQMKSRCS